MSNTRSSDKVNEKCKGKAISKFEESQRERDWQEMRREAKALARNSQDGTKSTKTKDNPIVRDVSDVSDVTDMSDVSDVTDMSDDDIGDDEKVDKSEELEEKTKRKSKVSVRGINYYIESF